MAPVSSRVLLFDPITWIDDWDYGVEREALGQVGAQLVVPTDRSERDKELARADVVVVSSIDRLTAHHVQRLERCVGILCYSAGMDAVDIAAAAEAAIPVTNVRAGTDDVADHAMTLLLAAWRMLPEMIEAAGTGKWDLADHPQFRGIRRLRGSTLGIYGVGAIGRTVANRARSFGMRIIGTYRRPESAEPDIPHVEVQRLFAESDVVVLTAALTSSTRGVVGKEVLAFARQGLILVNVGRGGLVVEADLADALVRGTVRAAALDVRETEPPDPTNDPLAGRPNVITTPHMAGVSTQALADLHRLAAEGIVSLLRQGGRL